MFDCCDIMVNVIFLRMLIVLGLAICKYIYI